MKTIKQHKKFLTNVNGRYSTNYFLNFDNFFLKFDFNDGICLQMILLSTSLLEALDESPTPVCVTISALLHDPSISNCLTICNNGNVSISKCLTIYHNTQCIYPQSETASFNATIATMYNASISNRLNIFHNVQCIYLRLSHNLSHY